MLSAWHLVRNVGQAWCAELGVLVAVLFLFLPVLGYMDLWDRREEHVAADAMDALRNSHWLVAWEHGRPRLKKPPLARWSSAALMYLTGRTDQFVVRLPAGLACVGTVVLIYFWGRRLAGRECGLAAAVIFSTNFVVVSEMWVMSAEP